MYARRLSVIFMLVAVAIVAVVPSYANESFAHFSSAESNCESGIFTIAVDGPLPSDAMRQPINNAIVTATDAEGTFLGQKSFYLPYLTGTYTHAIQYLVEPVDSVTFKLYLIPLDTADAQGVLGELIDQITVPVECGMPLPGCDVLIHIPSDSVVGEFLTDARTHWSPGKQLEPVVTIPGGQSAWVIGQDEAEEYYLIAWVCQYLWVHKETMGPNYDEVWLGAPLPTRIVN